MDYAALYQKKLTSAAEAVKVVKSGDWVDYGWCTNHPYTLDKALAARQNELKDVALQRHRPQDYLQGHGLFHPHALQRAAALLPRRQRHS